MVKKPIYSVPNIKDIHTIDRKGPWNTKSGGELNVLFGIPIDEIEAKFFNYNQDELDKLPRDVRGLRSYTVRNLATGSIGANEWHRIRNELVFAINGSAKWTCEDIYGKRVEFMLDQKSGVWTPPFILHTYEALQDNTELMVIANTLFFTDDPESQDTYSIDTFHDLQTQYHQ